MDRVQAITTWWIIMGLVVSLTVGLLTGHGVARMRAQAAVREARIEDHCNRRRVTLAR